MFKKVISSLTPNYQILREKTVFAILFCCALFIRLPFFFRDYIDRDESTFIIMAQSWVDGHLPYTELWDLKPPVIFLFFAMLIKLFGKSFIIIRFTGTILVTVTAFVTYKIGIRVSTKKVAFWTAIMTLVFQSLFGSLQGVMSEHIGVFFFVIGLYLVLFKKSWFWIFTSGLFLGLSLMSKLNMAYPILFLALYLLWEGYQLRKLNNIIFKLSLVVIGILLIVIGTAIPYLNQSELDVWWQSVFMAPMAYSTSRPSAIIKVSIFFLMISIWLVVSFKKGWLNFQKRELRVLAVVTFGVLFSFLQTGKFNGHYLILVYPSLSILMGVFISNISGFKHFNRPSLIALVFVLVPMEAYLEYAHILSNKMNKGTFFNGEGIEVPKYLINKEMTEEKVLFFEYHIGYWFLDKKPPTKASTHPSNILRESIFPYMQNQRATGMEELQYLMEDIQPKIVVTRRNRRVFDKQKPEANAYINAYLENNYEKLDSIDAAMIYRRLE